jgi:hypothetical protein
MRGLPCWAPASAHHGASHSAPCLLQLLPHPEEGVCIPPSAVSHCLNSITAHNLTADLPGSPFVGKLFTYYDGAHRPMH